MKTLDSISYQVIFSPAKDDSFHPQVDLNCTLFPVQGHNMGTTPGGYFALIYKVISETQGWSTFIPTFRQPWTGVGFSYNACLSPP